MEDDKVETAPGESSLVNPATVSEPPSSSSSSAEVDNKEKVVVGEEGGCGSGGVVEEVTGRNSVGGGGGIAGLGLGSIVPLERTDSISSESCRTPTATSSGGKDKDSYKINILLKPVGDAPILKQKLWAVPAERLVSQVTEFVKKYLKLEKNQNLFFFVNQLFAPSPDQCIRDLYECFGSDRKLVLHYSTTVAWG